MINGKWTGTMNLTEPQAGTDMSLLKTRAKRDGENYRITGQKIYITYGEQDFTKNIVHLVLARLPDAPPGVKGISLFLVPKFLVNEDGSLGKRNDVFAVNIDLNKTNAFIDLLPFKLTNSQNLVINEILNDLNSHSVMNRLLQGDVGSGKTVVALIAVLAMVFDGYQAAVMAPTEILAQQHYATLSRLFSFGEIIEKQENHVILTLPFFDKPITLGILIGSMNQSAKKRIVERLNKKEIDIIVGTHALIQDDVNIPNMGLAVVDEQHRFGVEQRAILRNKGNNPHMLAMSATPIPRSLNLTVYGDLDISVLDELPQGRKEIKTRFINDQDRVKAYEFTRQQLE